MREPGYRNREATHFHFYVMRATLEVLANRTEFGAEDASLCAFVAWEGPQAQKPERPE